MTLTKTASLFIIIAAILALLVLGEGLIIPFVIAVLIWYLINAFSYWIGSFKIVKRNLPNWASLIISTILIGLILFFIGSLIADNAAQLVVELPKYQKNIGNLITKFGEMLRFDTDQFFTGSGSDKVLDFSESFNKFLAQVNLSAYISKFLNTLSAFAGNAFLIFIYILFLFLEQAIFPKKIRALFPQEERYKRVKEIIIDINEAIRAYFKVKLTVSAVTAFVSYLLMYFVGLDFAVFWAFLIFILNFIPNIGSLIATIFPALLSLIQFENSFAPFFVIVIGVGAIQLIVGNFLEPKMMGSSLNLSSLVVLLALSVWGAIWGITGMILSVPITVIMMIIFAQFPSTRPVAILLSEKGELMHELKEIDKAED